MNECISWGGGKISESSLALCTEAPCFCLTRHEKYVDMYLEPQLLRF